MGEFRNKSDEFVLKIVVVLATYQNVHRMDLYHELIITVNICPINIIIESSIGQEGIVDEYFCSFLNLKI